MTKKIIDKLEEVDNHFKTAKFHSFAKVEELEEQGGVYCVYKDNQAIYVGISNNLQKRLKEFMSESRKPLRKKKKAINKAKSKLSDLINNDSIFEVVEQK